MKDKKIIAVVGGTGAQGGGLVRAILKDKESEFTVRAITRNAGSDKEKKKKKLGAEVVEADVNDKALLMRQNRMASNMSSARHWKPRENIFQLITTECRH